MQNMTIDNRLSLSSLMTAFAAFHPAQIAFLAWMFSFFFAYMGLTSLACQCYATG